MRTCIVSVAFREPYLRHSIKQEFLILANATADGVDLDTKFLRDQLPVKGGLETNDIVGTFQKSLYGFKPHAVQRAIDAGYKKIIWLDPSVLPTCSMQILIDALDEHPIIVRSGENNLADMCNDKAFKYFNVTHEELRLNKVRHVAGTIYGFNFNTTKAKHVFELWKAAEEDGIFGTQDEFMAGHWSDEACLALAMYCCSVKGYWDDKFTYLNQKEL